MQSATVRRHAVDRSRLLPATVTPSPAVTTESLKIVVSDSGRCPGRHSRTREAHEAIYHSEDDDGLVDVTDIYISPTGEDEEYSGDKGQNGTLGSDVSDVTDDKRCEDEQQGHHGEGRGGADHLYTRHIITMSC